ncbi:MAG: prenyltransferase/squalene oxidase repeat-containing protein [Planctomycetota bacterium]
MHTPILATLALLLFTPSLACAQGSNPSARKKGTIWKDEVDTLIDVLVDSERAAKLPALGGDSALATAKILAAMAKCHRRYYWPGDVPAVTRSVDFLIRHRRQDGGFGDAETTAWVVDALSLLPLDASAFGEEVAQARAFLTRQAAKVPVFQDRVQAVLDQVRADVFPQHLGKEAGGKVRPWLQSPQGLVRTEAAEALVQLVACQVANKALDRGRAGQDPKAAPAVTWSPAQQKAYAWLLGQQKHGVFHFTMGDKSFPDPAFTGFGLFALQTKPKDKRTADEQQFLDEGLRWLLANQNDDGTFGEQVVNYTTCVVVGALHKSGDPAALPALAKAQKAILGFQNSEAGGYQKGDRDYGSIGYGNSQRGDLSNLHFSLEALRQTGLPADHEAFQKALVFLQRTQNLKSVNDFKGKVPDPDRQDVVLDAVPGNNGGAAYYPGNSAAGYIVHPDGTSEPRSYGSMTYALLKSYTLAGVPGDDPRVQAAVQWIADNWTLAVNPGADPALGEKVQYQGLFYYYMVLAQALDAAKVATVKVSKTDDKGAVKVEEVDWRKALRAHLESIQQPDGTWINGKNERWMENLPLLCTCYAMVALERCQ